MESFIGTSGWSYGWNEKGTLDWYAAGSGLNAIELNFSFYRSPTSKMAGVWAEKGRSLRWAVKVSRFITHIYRMDQRAIDSWKKFREALKPLEPNIDFYLFQLPGNMGVSHRRTIESFANRIGIAEKFALEPRNMEWFSEEMVEWASNLGITWVSIDAPSFPREVYNTSGLVYVRMHGRQAWYSHSYTDNELKEVRDNIIKSKPRKAYVFFNNNTNMLTDSRRLLSLLKGL